ncbi:hypothetical protein F0726_02841 [Acidithiobacillus caldus]|nr:hypothetical protein F0726_02841 [Acidithiobacillus caldus]
MSLLRLFANISRKKLTVKRKIRKVLSRVISFTFLMRSYL